jgi:hypothetical protein
MIYIWITNIGTYEKVEGKSVPVLFNWAPRVWRSVGIAPRILDFNTRLRWVVSFTPRPLYSQGKNTWYPLDRRLGGPQSRSGLGGEEINSKPWSGLETPIIQPVAQRYSTELSRHLNVWKWHRFKRNKSWKMEEYRLNFCLVLKPHASEWNIKRNESAQYKASFLISFRL